MLSIDEIRARELNILTSVDSFCRENRIRYSLCGGTLIGAIRHKGYIPWDDDIDIFMPRPDYNRFIEIYDDSIYKIQTCSDDNNYIGLFTKVYDSKTLLKENGEFGEDVGVNIDVFPIDGLPPKGIKQKLYLKKMKFLQGLIVSASVKDYSKRPFVRKLQISIMKMFLSFIKDKHEIARYIINEAQKYNFEQSEYVAVVVWGYGEREVMSKESACNYIEHEFENKNLSIIRDYDKYLRSIYGDYMQLPPEEQRVNKHNMTVYIKEG